MKTSFEKCCSRFAVRGVAHVRYGVVCAADSSFRGIERFASAAAGTRVPSESMGTFLLAG